jgi:hypothetical protein
LSSFEQKIQTASHKLSDYIKGRDSELGQFLKDDFLEYCGDGSCDDAVINIMSSINGDSRLFGCDLVPILFEGIIYDGSFYQGWVDIILTKSAYLLSIVSQGITVVSTYETMKLGDDSTWIGV